MVININQSNRPFLMAIKPLWIREKFFWKLYSRNLDRYSYLFDNATLEFAPHISLKLMETDVSHKMLAFCGFYELLVSRRITKLAKLGGLMIDVGANYGYYSCLWAGAGGNNKVIAFEASPRNLSALKHNLLKNRLETQVDVHETAVGKEKGDLFFDMGPKEQSGWGGLLYELKSDAIKVPVISLDAIFLKSDYQNINVLKIDTEGADTWVIQGAEQLLRSHRIRHIFFEENIVRMEKLGIKPGESQKLLRDCGYQLDRIGVNEWYASLI
ncbi:FkbM family methyltransferase [Nostoc sp. CALU 1950]|uniref:FkbM family methyltransferase n=1 Tax=Nostoc sp. CALU 1950 TaxID=3104321 RepID=UPI003EC00DB1